ncbi:MAG: hypothetical protein RLY31_2250 [Bacteroidota bacterium]|jgi:23S rRNA (guanosine2251-2'-O)-methyltransferase
MESRKEKATMIFGRHPVMDAIQSGARFEKVFLQQGTRGDFERSVRQACREQDIPLQYVPKEKMARLSTGNHQGVIGFLALLPYHRLDDLIPLLFEQGAVPVLLLLDRITDVRNLGAIARSAEVCGANGLVLPKLGSALINADALKTSAGALTRLPVCRENSLVTAVSYMQASGIQVFASDLQAERHIFELDFTHPVALVLGSEDEGVHPSLLRQVDATFRIPQRGTTDSFNVSVAAGIMLYEVLRQRMGSGAQQLSPAPDGR